MKKQIRLCIWIGMMAALGQPVVGLPQSDGSRVLTLQYKALKLDFGFFDHNRLRLLTMLPGDYARTIEPAPVEESAGNEVFIHLTGENRNAHHGSKLTGGLAGSRLLFVDKIENPIPTGLQVILVQRDPVRNLRVESFYEFHRASPTIRRYTRVINEGEEAVGIEYVSSAVLHNYSNIMPGSPDENIRIHYAYNSWKQEAQWKTARPSDLGWNDNDAFNLNGIFMSNLGSWSTIQYLPMAMIEHVKAGITWFWQIEHNGSWHWEMSNASSWSAPQSTYLYLGGPDEDHSRAWKQLMPGESYQTVPVALGCVSGGFDAAVAALTRYRRDVIIKPHEGYQACPVIFNDYMNCLEGNPTTEKELPLIEAASRAGCDYFVIDAGWYAELNESWWDAVGLWQPSQSRFPGGLKSLMAAIRDKGMIPGLWLEPEVVGIKSPLKDKPDDWFFCRHGQRVIDNGRYLLDFRNPEVVRFADSVVDRLVSEYGAGYIKMDYNNTVWGTEILADSPGQGLLQHNRAVVQWYGSCSDRYPQLVIENCGSGGCRMDYAMLSQTQLQSSSDQTDYKKYPAIVVGALAAVVPEQLAVWSYPLAAADPKEAAFNMVNAMMCRIHQSGNLSQLSPASYDQVRKGITVYKTLLASFIPTAHPFFPLGMPAMADEVNPVAVGLRHGNQDYVAVWRLQGEKRVIIPMNYVGVELIYPQDLGIKVAKGKNALQVEFPDEYMAAIIKVTH
ncbi:MAG: alpha-galactosidase [Calditrichaeota bacterium]|nr:MAG: alpha-galactosidase [Calditrichota bacterium]